MSARAWIVAVWALLCLGGLAATSALDAGPATKKPTPRETAVDTAAVDCERIADEIERDRAEARETPQPTGRPDFVAQSVAVAQECADELEERGLR
ncbi:hypothetical protein [Streptomyces sp. NPDC001978]|uniref:hypothetical protein n=1 Tax=Streptomyces sp. NPDC001978 TaxID=3364627 RepID=UPI003686CBA6